jgi:hypothetical protein
VKTKELLEKTVKALHPTPVSVEQPSNQTNRMLTIITSGSRQCHLGWSDSFVHDQRGGRNGCQDHHLLACVLRRGRPRHP